MRRVKVKCIKSTGGAFIVGCEYEATLINADWYVKGSDGCGYATTNALWGRIGYSSACRKERFVFDPV